MDIRDKKLKSFYTICILGVLLFSFSSVMAMGEQTLQKMNTNWIFYIDDADKEELPERFIIKDTSIISKNSYNLSLIPDQIKNVKSAWFKVKIPDIKYDNSCIYFEQINGKSIDIYLDNDKVFHRYKKGIYLDSSINKVIIPVDRKYSGKYIYMRVDTEEVIDSIIGPRKNVYFGSHEELISMYNNNGIGKIILGCILAFLGVGVIFCSLFLNKKQRSSVIYMGIFILFIGFEVALTFNDINMYFGNLEQYLTIIFEGIRYLFPNLLLLFLIKTFEANVNQNILKKLLIALNMYSLLCFTLLVLRIGFKLQYYIYFIFTVNVLLVIYIIVFCILLVYIIYLSVKKDIDAKIMLSGIFILIFSLLIDFIKLNIYIDYDMSLWIMGAYGFVFSLLSIFGRRTFENWKSVKKYSEELRISSEQLAELNKTLEQRVFERTKQMEMINRELTDTNNELFAINQELASTMEQLQETQEQLIQSEKMAAIGHLVAGVAHEINSPLGAIQASTANLYEYMEKIYDKIPKLFDILTGEEQRLFFTLVKAPLTYEYSLSTREERKMKKDISALLEKLNIKNADMASGILIDMGVQDGFENYLQLLQKEDNIFLMQTAYNLSGLQRNCKNIEQATTRASKIVFALKNYARQDQEGKMIKADIVTGIEMTLLLYQNQIKHNVKVIKEYESVPEILCYPDELNQVWSNLILNGLQAMEFNGTLEIKVLQRNEAIEVKITDNGKGIPLDIQNKIFQPFFTTKPQGEGTGLGLDIVKKIVVKHKGKIDVNSVGGRTTFTVTLPV